MFMSSLSPPSALPHTQTTSPVPALKWSIHEIENIFQVLETPRTFPSPVLIPGSPWEQFLFFFNICGPVIMYTYSALNRILPKVYCIYSKSII